MVLEKLGQSLKNTMEKIARSVFVDDSLLNELIKDIQRSLLEADVNVHLVFDLTNKIKERAKKEESPSTITKKEQLINIVYEELVNFLGEETSIDIKKKPFKIMLVGLYGNGKTTTAGKLANYYSKRGHKVAIVALDVHRPAAIDQVQQLAESINVTSIADRGEKSPGKIWNNNLEKIDNHDVILIDTAGRTLYLMI